MTGTRSPATSLVIYGAGGMGQEAADIALAMGIEVVGFVDDRSDLVGKDVLGIPVLGDRAWLAKSDLPVFVAVGAPANRRRVCNQIGTYRTAEVPALVHPTAYVGRACEIGPGSVVAASATLTADVRVGRHVVINAGATVSHNSRLADFVTVAPGAHLAGDSSVDEGADIGIGASVIQGLSIGRWSIIGAGAVVIGDVDPDVTVVGCPSRVIATRQAGWHLK